MQFIKFISNTLKISVENLFYSFHVKESKKNISCNNFIKKNLKLRVKKQKVCAGHVHMAFISACD